MSVVDYQGVNAGRGLSKCFLGDLIVNIEILNWPDQAWIANILVFVQRLFTYLQLQDSSEVKREGDCERSRCDTIV